MRARMRRFSRGPCRRRKSPAFRRRLILREHAAGFHGQRRGVANGRSGHISASANAASGSPVEPRNAPRYWSRSLKQHACVARGRGAPTGVMPPMSSSIARSCPRERATSRDDDGDRSPDEPHFVPGDHRLDEPFEALDRSEPGNGGDDVPVGGDEDRLDARTCLCRAQIDAPDPAMAIGLRTIAACNSPRAPFGDEGPRPEQPRLLDPFERLTHRGAGLDRHRGEPRGPLWAPRGGQLAFTPAAAAIFILVETSACTSFSNADVVRIIGSAPKRASFSCTAGFSSALRVSA